MIDVHLQEVTRVAASAGGPDPPSRLSALSPARSRPYLASFDCDQLRPGELKFREGMEDRAHGSANDRPSSDNMGQLSGRTPRRWGAQKENPSILADGTKEEQKRRRTKEGNMRKPGVLLHLRLATGAYR